MSELSTKKILYDLPYNINNIKYINYKNDNICVIISNKTIQIVKGSEFESVKEYTLSLDDIRSIIDVEYSFSSKVFILLLSDDSLLFLPHDCNDLSFCENVKLSNHPYSLKYLCRYDVIVITYSNTNICLISITGSINSLPSSIDSESNQLTVLDVVTLESSIIVAYNDKKCNNNISVICIDINDRLLQSIKSNHFNWLTNNHLTKPIITVPDQVINLISHTDQNSYSVLLFSTISSNDISITTPNIKSRKSRKSIEKSSSIKTRWIKYNNENELLYDVKVNSLDILINPINSKVFYYNSILWFVNNNLIACYDVNYYFNIFNYVLTNNQIKSNSDAIIIPQGLVSYSLLSFEQSILYIQSIHVNNKSVVGSLFSMIGREPRDDKSNDIINNEQLSYHKNELLQSINETKPNILVSSSSVFLQYIQTLDSLINLKEDDWSILQYLIKASNVSYSHVNTRLISHLIVANRFDLLLDIALYSNDISEKQVIQLINSVFHISEDILANFNFSFHGLIYDVNLSNDLIGNKKQKLNDGLNLKQLEIIRYLYYNLLHRSNQFSNIILLDILKQFSSNITIISLYVLIVILHGKSFISYDDNAYINVNDICIVNTCNWIECFIDSHYNILSYEMLNKDKNIESNESNNININGQVFYKIINELYNVISTNSQLIQSFENVLGMWIHIKRLNKDKIKVTNSTKKLLYKVEKVIF